LWKWASRRKMKQVNVSAAKGLHKKETYAAQFKSGTAADAVQVVENLGNCEACSEQPQSQAKS